MEIEERELEGAKTRGLVRGLVQGGINILASRISNQKIFEKNAKPTGTWLENKVGIWVDWGVSDGLLTRDPLQYPGASFVVRAGSHPSLPTWVSVRQVD